MPIRRLAALYTSLTLCCIAALPAAAQSFRVQCPTSTITHPSALTNVNAEPAYTAPTVLAPGSGGYLAPTSNVNGAIKCQQISGGDGYATMGDGTQTYMFSFGPLSGLADIAAGGPGTEFPSVFNTVYPGIPLPGDPATTIAGGGTFLYNGAVGLTGDQSVLVAGGGGGAAATATIAGGLVTDVTVTNPGSGYQGRPTVTFSPAPPGGTTALGTATAVNGQISFIDITYTGTGYLTAHTITIGPASNACAPVSGPSQTQPPAQCLTGHVDSRQIEDIAVMNGNIPAPLMAIDEDDEFFLTLTNVGMIMRPHLFEQHTVHFHGYPNASSFFDGVPDASVAINIAASFTYYYLAPDAGTYFWHCHITPPEHLQMGMVGQLFVRPRQNRVPTTQTLNAALVQQQGDLRTACRRYGDTASPAIGQFDSPPDILCSNPVPAVTTAATGGGTYAYNDGDGSTRYDVDYPLQMHGFDPNFHFVGMTFNPEGFTDMKDKYFL